MQSHAGAASVRPADVSLTHGAGKASTVSPEVAVRVGATDVPRVYPLARGARIATHSASHAPTSSPVKTHAAVLAPDAPVAVAPDAPAIDSTPVRPADQTPITSWQPDTRSTVILHPVDPS